MRSISKARTINKLFSYANGILLPAKRKACRNSTTGFTLIELIVVLGVFGVLLGLVTVNLLRAQHQPTLSASVDTLIADLKSQQAKAMSGAGAISHGVYVGEGEYVLFSGSVYNANDPANAQVLLDANVIVSSVTFPNASIVFAAGSGDIVNFDAAYRMVTLRNTQSSEEKAIQMNRYGVVSAVN